MSKDQTIERIRKGVVRADDIKHKWRLTDDQIAEIPTLKVYEWIKLGKWTSKDFHTWLKVLRVTE